MDNHRKQFPIRNVSVIFILCVLFKTKHLSSFYFKKVDIEIFLLYDAKKKDTNNWCPTREIHGITVKQSIIHTDTQQPAHFTYIFFFVKKKDTLLSVLTFRSTDYGNRYDTDSATVLYKFTLFCQIFFKIKKLRMIIFSAPASSFFKRRGINSPSSSLNTKLRYRIIS